MRSHFWDTLKGLAIIAVMAIHVLAALSVSPNLEVIIRQFINFSVPMFMAITGYFTYKPDIGPTVTFWRSKLKRLLPPYLIWTSICILIFHRTHLQSGVELAEDYLLGKGIGWGIGYFVIVLLQLILITPLLLKIKKPSNQLFLIGISFVVSMAYTYTIKIGFGHSVYAAFPYNVLPFFIWLPFYQLGLLMGQLKARQLSFSWQLLGTLYVLFVASAIIEGLVINYFGYGFGTSQVKISSFLASGTLFLLAVSFQAIQVKKSPVSWVGANSYAIYLIHTIVIAGVSLLLNPRHNWIMNAGLLAMLVLVGTPLLVLALRKLLPELVGQRVLG